MRDWGYTAEARIIKAHEHGMPTKRTRLFIVAISGDVQIQ